MKRELGYIYMYYLLPKGKSYCYDVLTPKFGVSINRSGIYREFVDIFFSGENILIDGISQDFSKEAPVVFKVFVYNGIAENIKHYAHHIVPLLNRVSSGNKSELISHLNQFIEKNMDLKEKAFIFYKLVSYFYYTYYLGEARIIPYKTFMSKLQGYYDKQNCDVEFRIDHNQTIDTFKVLPRGKYFYYDKTEPDKRIGMDYEVFNELKKVFFPDEDISVYGIRKLNFEHEPFKIKVRKGWNI